MRLVYLFVTGALLASGATAQSDPPTLQPVIRVVDGPVYALHRTDTGYTVYQDGRELVVGVPQRAGDAVIFEETGRLELPGRATAFASEGERVYAATDLGLAVVDITGPDGPYLDAFVPPSEAMGDFGYWDVVVHQGHVYAGGWGGGGFDVFALTAGTPPTWIAGIQASGGSRTMLAAKSSTLFVVAGYPGYDGRDVVAYDVSVPAAPAELSFFEYSATKYGVSVIGDVLYVATTGGLLAMDAVAPDILQQIAQHESSNWFLSVEPDGTGQPYVFSAVYEAAAGVVRTLDLGPGALVFGENLALSGLPHAATWDPALNAFTIAMDTQRLRFVDVGTDAIEMEGPTAGGYAERAILDGAMLYVALYNEAGLRVLDVSVPDTPVERSRVDVPGRNVAMAARDGMVYLLQRTDGFRQHLWIIDAHNPDDPQILTTLDGGQGADGGLALKGDRLHVASGGERLVVYDVFQPDAPRLVARYPISGNEDVDIVGVALDTATGRVHAVDADQDRLLVFDSEGPRGLRLLGAVDLPIRPEQVAVHDGRALVIDYNEWVLVDTRDLDTPIVSAVTNELGHSARAAAADASGFYVTTANRLVQFDADGETTGTFELGHDGWLTVSPGGFLTAALHERGVLVFETSLTTGATGTAIPEALRFSVVPNPARGAARLTVTLGAPADIKAAVYDVLGRRVATLTEGAHAAGPHALDVETAGWAPGVYTVRVRAGEAVATQRLTVVR